MNKEIMEEMLREDALSKISGKLSVKKAAKKIKEAVKGKNVMDLLLGYNPASRRLEAVVLTTEGFVHIPLKVVLAPMEETLNSLSFVRLYYTQEILSEFIEKLGEKVGIEVNDRCLYAWYLNREIVKDSVEDNETDFFDFCKEKQSLFRSRYEEQLSEIRESGMTGFSYNNYGFGARYIASREIKKAINAICKKKHLIEQAGCWKEAEKIIKKLEELL